MTIFTSVQYYPKKLSLLTWIFKREQKNLKNKEKERKITASSGIRTRGTCLEGKYVTATTITLRNLEENFRKDEVNRIRTNIEKMHSTGLEPAPPKSHECQCLKLAPATIAHISDTKHKFDLR